MNWWWNKHFACLCIYTDGDCCPPCMLQGVHFVELNSTPADDMINVYLSVRSAPPFFLFVQGGACLGRSIRRDGKMWNSSSPHWLMRLSLSSLPTVAIVLNQCVTPSRWFRSLLCTILLPFDAVEKIQVDFRSFYLYSWWQINLNWTCSTQSEKKYFFTLLLDHFSLFNCHIYMLLWHTCSSRTCILLCHILYLKQSSLYTSIIHFHRRTDLVRGIDSSNHRCICLFSCNLLCMRIFRLEKNTHRHQWM